MEVVYPFITVCEHLFNTHHPLGALLSILAGGKIDPIDTIDELGDTPYVVPLMLKGAIFYDRIRSFENRAYKKVASRVKFFDIYDYTAACQHLAKLTRYAFIAPSLKMACGSGEFGEALLYLPVSNPSNTFYQDIVAIPFPKQSNLTSSVNDV